MNLRLFSIQNGAELLELSLSSHVRPSPPTVVLLLRSSPSSSLAPLCWLHSGESILSISPSFPPLNRATPPPPKSAGAKLLPMPFRPHLSLLLLTSSVPGCASTGNTLCCRRRHVSATGGPAPRSLSLLSLSAANRRGEERRREEGGGEEKEK